MLSDEQILEKAARDGSIDIAEWPRVLDNLLQRLHHIVYNDFPLPSIPLPTPASLPIDPEVVSSTPPRFPTGGTQKTEQEQEQEQEQDQEHELPDADNDDPANSQSSTKENDAPTELAASRWPPGNHPPNPAFDISQSQPTDDLPSAHLGSRETPTGAMPPDLRSLYETSQGSLQHNFATSPPYTIQRLAELVLRPTAHHRFLPAYLRALDRVISVSSPISDFPLPSLHQQLHVGFLTNGDAQTNGGGEREGLGSDESLGGALLTPIPWLRNQGNLLTPTAGTGPGGEGELHSESTETIEGPHGAGSIETVSVTVNGISSASAPSHTTSSSPIASPTLSEQSDASSSSAESIEAQLREQGGVTQGELLRQEQEAGVVPVNPSGQPMMPRRTLTSGGAAAVGRDAAGPIPAPSGAAADVVMDEEQPHARGPELIGMEDMGPQPHPRDIGRGMLGIEAAVGRGRSRSPQPPPAEETPSKQEEEMEGVEPGKPGQDPKDVETEVEKLKEAMDREKEEEKAKDADGDIMVADADGKDMKYEDMGVDKPDAVDTTGQ